MNFSWIRENLYLVIWIAAVLIFVVPSVIYWLKLSINRRAVRIGVRAARKAEQERKAELTRIARQAKIGDLVHWSLHKELVAPYARDDRFLSIDRDVFGACCVSVDQVDDGEYVIKRLLNVTIDFRRPWNRRVEVTVGDLVQWPVGDAEAICRHIKYLLKEFKIFGD